MATRPRACCRGGDVRPDPRRESADDVGKVPSQVLDLEHLQAQKAQIQ